jgi:hypothetical protein
LVVDLAFFSVSVSLTHITDIAIISDGRCAQAIRGSATFFCGSIVRRYGRFTCQYRAGIERAVSKGWLHQHESGTYVKLATRELSQS